MHRCPQHAIFEQRRVCEFSLAKDASSPIFTLSLTCRPFPVHCFYFSRPECTSSERGFEEPSLLSRCSNHACIFTVFLLCISLVACSSTMLNMVFWLKHSVRASNKNLSNTDANYKKIEGELDFRWKDEKSGYCSPSSWQRESNLQRDTASRDKGQVKGTDCISPGISHLVPLSHSSEVWSKQ